MVRAFERWLAKKSQPQAAKSGSHGRKPWLRAYLKVEDLEARDLLSGTYPAFTLDSGGNLYHMVGSQQQLIDTGVQDFAVVGNRVFDLHVTGILASLNPDGSGKSTVDSGVISFAAAPNGSVYVLGGDGKLWQEGGTPVPDLAGSWSINGQPTQIQENAAGLTFTNEHGNVSAGTFISLTQVMATGWGNLLGTITGSPGQYVLNWGNGTVWHETAGSPASGRVQVDNGVVAIAPAPGGALYVLGSDGKLWDEAAGWQASGRAQLATNVQSFAVAGDGTRFYLQGSSQNGGILYSLGTDGRPHQVTLDLVAAIAAAPNGVVYRIDQGSLLFKYVGGVWTQVPPGTVVTDFGANPPIFIQLWEFQAQLWRSASMPMLNVSRTAVQYRNTQVVYDSTVWAADYSYTDILQFDSGICTFASALASAANAGINLAARIQYLGNNYYNVFLYEAGWQRVYFDGTVYAQDLQPTTQSATRADGSTVLRLTNYWPLLFARAYLQYQGHVDWRTDPGSDNQWFQGWLGIHWGGRAPWQSPKNAGYALAGEDKNNWDTDEGSAIGHLSDNLNLHSVCIVGTQDPTYGASADAGHEWAVLGLWRRADGTWMVRLYNPWGGAGATRDLDWSQFEHSFDTIVMVTRDGISY